MQKSDGFLPPLFFVYNKMHPKVCLTFGMHISFGTHFISGAVFSLQIIQLRLFVFPEKVYGRTKAVAFPVLFAAIIHSVDCLLCQNRSSSGIPSKSYRLTS